MTTRIFVVEDHVLMRNMMEDFLAAQPGVTVCGTATTGEEALERIEASRAVIALIDVSLPGINGIEVLKAMRDRCPDIRCIMHSGHGELSYVDQALDAGAIGYVLKGRPAELPEAIESALRDETYLSATLRGRHRTG